MKRMLFLSTAFHAFVAAALLISPLPFRHALFVPAVYQVDLVTLPSPREAEPPETPVPPQKVIEEPSPPPKPEPKVKKAEEKPKASKGLPEPKPIPRKPAPEKTVKTPAEKTASAESKSPKMEEAAKPKMGAPSMPSITAGVEAPDFKFPFYLKLLQAKISSVWSPPAVGVGDEPKEVIISFVLFQTGRIQEVLVERSSGNTFFDQAALRAVYMANPLPPLPRGFREPHLKVHFSFVLSRKG
jgi:TonB family protein